LLSRKARRFGGANGIIGSRKEGIGLNVEEGTSGLVAPRCKKPRHSQTQRAHLPSVRERPVA